MTLHCLFMQPAIGDAAIDYSAQEFRQFTRSQITIHTGTADAQGVTTTGGYQVTQRGAGANMSVDVAAGSAYVVGDDVSLQGTYFSWLDATQNVTGFTVPGAGTFHHRVCLQIQDKLNNGAWTGYVSNLVLVLDTGGGLPAEPASAITLATVDIAAAAGSIVNANITDYRARMGPAAGSKTSSTSRGNTTLADDPDLQMLNLQPGATYHVTGSVFYNGGSGANEGDIKYSFRTSSGTGGRYRAARRAPGGTDQPVQAQVWGDTPAAQTDGTGNDHVLGFDGQYTTGTAPAYLVFQWAQNTSAATNTTVEAGSLLVARRVG